MMPFRIIVADKNTTTAGELAEMFSGRDVQFLPVESAAELKQAIKTQKPSLIMLAPLLTDTPHWRAGQKIVAAIKESHEYQDIPVIGLGGDPDGPSESQLQSLCADAYLSKPLNPQETVRLIESLLQISPPASPQIDDDDIVIDFDDDGEDTESYVEDKPIAMAPHSEHIFEPDPGVATVDHLPVTSPVVNEDIQVIDRPDELTDLRFEPDDAAQDTEPVDSLERGFLEYSVSPDESIEEPLDVIPNSREGIPDTSELAFSLEQPSKGTSAGSDELDEYQPTFSAPDTVDSQEIPFGYSEDKDVFQSTLVGILPHKNTILDCVRRSITEALPTRGELLTIVNDHIDSLLPSKDDVLFSVTERLSVRNQQSVPHEEIASTSLAWKAVGKNNESGLESISRTMFPTEKEKEDEPEISTTAMPRSQLTVDDLVKTIIHEKIDDIMPDRNQILQWIRNEVDSRILETVEKIIRQKVEEITADTSYNDSPK